jgi:hypothetical protein
VNRAKDALAKMNSEAASKRYDAAKSYAAEAIAAAERAITEGRTGAERARNDAAALVAQLPPLLAETEQGMNAAKAAGLPLEFDSLDREYATARSNAGDAQFSLSNSRYQDAINQGQNARAGLNSINQQLSNAVMAVSRKK